MKNKIIIAAFSTAIAIYVTSCTDIVSTNLSKSSITILAPANNFVSQNYTQQFWWEVVEGAEKYNVQIVKPSFASGQQLIVDTLISGNKYSQTLQPGAYQWRVRAQNNSSNTDYVTYNLTIDSTLNLSSQMVLLNTPSDNFYADSLTQNLSWFAMPNATEYIFRIVNQSGIQIGNSESTSSTDISYTFPGEGTYKWRVSALNSQSSSPSTEYTIIIDITMPITPVLSFAPINDTTRLKPVPLAWNSVETNASYYLQISTDSTFTSIVKDTTTSDLTYNFRNPITNQFYFWRLRAIDLATNVGAYSSRRKFKVVP